ncbi:methyltransferase domain-containing protein [Streptomyces sp. NPDC048606]|uniref:class I SAM-dependent methyltransferase n=1 Tax=Streptomyces sp. NPDC048606 TaxID=3154726 RepID=UPI003417E36A
MPNAPYIALDSTGPGAVDGRQIRALTFQSVRLEYLRQVLSEVDLAPAGSRALVVGSGRGLLAQGLARLGFEVVATDPSPTATALAQKADDGLGVTYLTSSAETLDLPDDSFDLVYCADTLEITERHNAVLAEAARVLRPGGAFVYDTVNRTPLSRLIYLGAFQAIPGTRIMPPGRYAAHRLRRPTEVALALAQVGLTTKDVTAFKPRNVQSLVRATHGRRRGTLTDEQLPGLVAMVLTPKASPLVTYLGYAIHAA